MMMLAKERGVEHDYTCVALKPLSIEEDTYARLSPVEKELDI